LAGNVIVLYSIYFYTINKILFVNGWGIIVGIVVFAYLILASRKEIIADKAQSNE